MNKMLSLTLYPNLSLSFCALNCQEYVMNVGKSLIKDLIRFLLPLKLKVIHLVEMIYLSNIQLGNREVTQNFLSNVPADGFYPNYFSISLNYSQLAVQRRALPRSFYA